MAFPDAESCADDIFTLSADRAGDPDGVKLCGVLDTHLAYDRARTTRRRWVAILLATSGLTWLLAMPPTRLVPASTTSLGTAACGALALCAAMAGLVEWQRYSRWRRAMTEHGTIR